MDFLQTAIPDNLGETIATIVITILSWWLGHRKGKHSEQKQHQTFNFKK